MVLVDVTESLLQKVKISTLEEHLRERERAKPQVLPCVHKASHNLMKVATRRGIPVVFSAPNELAQLCQRTSSA